MDKSEGEYGTHRNFKDGKFTAKGSERKVLEQQPANVIDDSSAQPQVVPAADVSVTPSVVPENVTVGQGIYSADAVINEGEMSFDGGNVVIKNGLKNHQSGEVSFKNNQNDVGIIENDGKIKQDAAVVVAKEFNQGVDGSSTQDNGSRLIAINANVKGKVETKGQSIFYVHEKYEIAKDAQHIVSEGSYHYAKVNNQHGELILDKSKGEYGIHRNFKDGKLIVKGSERKVLEQQPPSAADESNSEPQEVAAADAIHRTGVFISEGQSEYENADQHAGTITYHSSAKDKKQNAVVSADHIIVEGQQSETNTLIDAGKYETQAGSNTRKDNVVVKADIMKLDGDRHNRQSVFAAKQELQLGKNKLYSENCVYMNQGQKIDYGSNGEFVGNNYFIAKNRISLADDASLTGSGTVVMDAKRFNPGKANVTVANVQLNIKNLNRVNDIIHNRGKYQNFKPGQSLGINTNGHVKLEKLKDSRSISVEADEITAKEKINVKQQLHLKSKKGDINLKDNVVGENTFIDSARDVNLANGVEAKGRNYINTNAARDVNLKNKRQEVKGRHDTEVNFKPAKIVGGKGVGADGVGAHVHAGNKVKLKASMVESIGSNIVQGDNGVVTKHDAHTYVSDKHKHRKFLGKKKSYTVDTTIARSAIVSKEGRNSVSSVNGKADVTATDFVAKDGTTIKTKHNSRYREAIGKREKYKEKKSWAGLSHKKSHHKQQFAQGVTFVDQGNTTLESTEGNVLGTGVSAFGPGKLIVIAPNGKAVFDVSILDNSFKSESTGINISNPLVDTLKINDFGLTQLAQMDPTVRDVVNMLNPNSGFGYLNGAANAGVSAYNSYQQIQNSGAGAYLANTLGLSGADGFNPSVNIGLTKTKIHGHYQTASQSIFQRGGIVLITKENPEFIGVNMDISGDFEVRGTVKPTEAIFRGVMLQSRINHKFQSVTFGVNAIGCTHVGMSHSETTLSSTQYVPVHINVNGKLISDIDKLVLDNAVFRCNDRIGRLAMVEVISRQNQNVVNSSAWSLNSSGAFAFHQSHDEQKIVPEVAGFHVEQGIKRDPENPINVRLVGGQVSAGEGKPLEFNKVEAIKVRDKEVHEGRGIAVNIGELLPKEPNGADSSPPQINKVIGVTYDKDEKVIEHLPTIAGTAGETVAIGNVNGQLNHDINNAARTVRDKHTHHDIRLPNLQKVLADAARKIKTAEDSKKSDKVAIDPANIQTSPAEPAKGDDQKDSQPITAIQPVLVQGEALKVVKPTSSSVAEPNSQANDPRLVVDNPLVPGAAADVMIEPIAKVGNVTNEGESPEPVVKHRLPDFTCDGKQLEFEMWQAAQNYDHPLPDIDQTPAGRGILVPEKAVSGNAIPFEPLRQYQFGDGFLPGLILALPEIASVPFRVEFNGFGAEYSGFDIPFKTNGFRLYGEDSFACKRLSKALDILLKSDQPFIQKLLVATRDASNNNNIFIRGVTDASKLEFFDQAGAITCNLKDGRKVIISQTKHTEYLPEFLAHEFTHGATKYGNYTIPLDSAGQRFKLKYNTALTESKINILSKGWFGHKPQLSPLESDIYNLLFKQWRNYPPREQFAEQISYGVTAMAKCDQTLTKMAPKVSALLNSIESEVSPVAPATKYTLPTRLKNIAYDSLKVVCPAIFWGLEIFIDKYEHSDDANRGLLPAIGAGSAKFVIGLGESHLIGLAAVAAGLPALTVGLLMVGGSLVSELGPDLDAKYWQEWQKFPGFPEGATPAEKLRIYQDFKTMNPYADHELVGNAIAFQKFFKAIAPHRIYNLIWSLFPDDKNSKDAKLQAPAGNQQSNFSHKPPAPTFFKPPAAIPAGQNPVISNGLTPNK